VRRLAIDVAVFQPQGSPQRLPIHFTHQSAAITWRARSATHELLLRLQDKVDVVKHCCCCCYYYYYYHHHQYHHTHLLLLLLLLLLLMILHYHHTHLLLPPLLQLLLPRVTVTIPRRRAAGFEPQTS